MKIDGTEFGSITIDKEVYRHDVLIRQTGEIVKRKKKLSKELYGTSHILSLAEAEFIYQKGDKLFIIGTGQSGNLKLSPEAAAYFARHDCRIVAEPTPRAIAIFNEAHGPKIGLFHVTC